METLMHGIYDDAALHERVMEFDDMSYSYALGICKSHETALDLVQIAYMKIWSAKPNHELLGAQYVKKTIYNEWVRLLKKQRLESLSAVPIEESFANYYKPEYKSSAAIQKLEALQATMTRKEWAVLMTVHSLGYNEAYKEGAELLGISYEAFKCCMKRASKKVEKFREQELSK